MIMSASLYADHRKTAMPIKKPNLTLMLCGFSILFSYYHANICTEHNVLLIDIHKGLHR